MLIPVCKSVTNRNTSQILSQIAFSSPSNLTIVSNRIDGEWIINSISLIIFILALLGNTAALVVMFGSRGPIRLTNNKYLVNLACADLLRACFMPFTIMARMKRNFMFGPIICKILPIIQGLSVAVDVFTLVCISVERYIAICRPLLILKLQSLRFAHFLNGLILFLIWTFGLLTALPNFFMYNLCSFSRNSRFKCEKVESQLFDGRIYMVALVVFYFLAPMIIMLVLYTLIIFKMYNNNTAMRMRSFQGNNPSKTYSHSSSPPPVVHNGCQKRYRTSSDLHQSDSIEQKCKKTSSNGEIVERIPSGRSSSKSRSGLSENDEHHQISSYSSKYIKNDKVYSKSNPIVRHSLRETKRRFFNSNPSRSSSSTSRLSSSGHSVYRMDRHRRKALKLLIVIILEFFICWTPLFIYHTFGTFDKKFYRSMPNIFVDLILLFSFASPLCNPFTYYFMSKRYRAVLYAYIPYCYTNTNKQKLSKKNQQAREILNALRLHQQENSFEYKQKSMPRKFSSPKPIRYYPKIRANTLQ